MSADLAIAFAIITAARGLVQLLEDADASAELRVCVVGGETPWVCVEVLPGAARESDRTAAVDYLAVAIGTEPRLAAVADRFLYAAEAEAGGIAFQVLALLPQVPEPAERER